ncbi:MAG: PAS domain-containing protein [Deltaproteobacteria bacterium]|jgi:PAS domain S-box-containing protein|nr:PAS domain-containing protein [Deltaproteobacteria bacterium]
MVPKEPSITNIAFVGGGDFCREILEKTTAVYEQEEMYAPILAVADPDPASAGMVLADQYGLLTFQDYRQLYDRRYNINLIIILTPEQQVFDDILRTRPRRIRILSYQVFRIFWQAIGQEERKLRERTEEMETIINGIQDFILVITPEMEIIDANESFLTKMRYNRKDVIGKKCFQVYHRIDHPCNHGETDCPLKEIVRNKRQCRKIQTRLMPDGQKRYYEVNIYPIWEKDGKISRFIHISRDITQHKKEEEELTQRLEQMVEDRTRQLKETHEKLLHQDKMSSLGKLSASVVHEINNPIAGILNLIMLMKRIAAEDVIREKEIDQFKQYLDLMENETRRTSRIVSNLLAFSRQSKMAPRRLSINQLINKTLFLNSNLLKIDGVKVETKLDPDLPDLLGSEDQLQQVFMNLVSNAAEAMEQRGGKLTIETRHLLREDKLKIKFKDTGHGIPEGDIPKLFEPFFTTKKKGKGVGLGLSVAYGIVQEHEGSIYVKSTVGQGTTFQVKLPLKSVST